jgi:hypothetical protein
LSSIRTTIIIITKKSDCRRYKKDCYFLGVEVTIRKPKNHTVTGTGIHTRSQGTPGQAVSTRERRTRDGGNRRRGRRRKRRESGKKRRGERSLKGGKKNSGAGMKRGEKRNGK